MHVVGIDPGKTGAAVAVPIEGVNALAYRFIFDKTGLLDIDHFRQHFLNHLQVNLIVMEKVQARGGAEGANKGQRWGTASAFAMGMSYGQLRLAICKYPHRLVTPQAWQKWACEGIPAKAGSQKDRTELAYKQLFPHLPVPKGVRGGKPDGNTIDALMLAAYGMIRYTNGRLSPWQLGAHDDENFKGLNKEVQTGAALAAVR